MLQLVIVIDQDQDQLVTITFILFYICHLFLCIPCKHMYCHTFQFNACALCCPNDIQRFKCCLIKVWFEYGDVLDSIMMHRLTLFVINE